MAVLWRSQTKNSVWLWVASMTWLQSCCWRVHMVHSRHMECLCQTSRCAVVFAAAHHTSSIDVSISSSNCSSKISNIGDSCIKQQA